MKAAVVAGNAKLSRVEQIKRFTIVAEPWEPGGVELTPTMKLRRNPIATKTSTSWPKTMSGSGRMRGGSSAPITTR